MPQIEYFNCPEDLCLDIPGSSSGIRPAVVFPPVNFAIPPGSQCLFFEVPENRFEHVVVISHAAVSGVDYRHPQCIDEKRSDKRTTGDIISKLWRDWEKLARESVPGDRLLILRLPFMVFGGANDALNLVLRKGVIPRRHAFDCAFQVLSKEQFQAALSRAIEERLRGVFNIAPRGVIHASQLALRNGIQARYMSSLDKGSLCGVKNLSAGWWQLFRYPCTIDGSRFEEVTGIDWSAFPAPFGQNGGKDPFGLDPETVRHTFWHRFAARRYWRMEVTGQVEIPKTGSAILIGPHRGFMPYDAIMMAYWMAAEHGRIPRYLVHHCLLRYPLLGQYIRRMGGLPACQENALHTLHNGEILAVFPEGIQGTFRYYRQTYTLGSFGRGDYLRWALETNSPILPYVCSGPSEAYPIFFKINWPWWKRTIEWPAFPITATWPVIPLPLPTKWHFHFLPAIWPRERFPNLDPGNERGIRKASKAIRADLQDAMFKLRSRRRNWFWGSLRTSS